MTTVAPPPPPQVPTQSLPPQPTVTVPNPPVALAKLALGARLEANLLLAKGGEALPPNQAQVQTPLGNLTLQAGFPLPKTGTLTLQVLAQGPQPQLLVAAIDGKPTAAGLKAMQTAAQAQTATPNPAAAASGAPIVSLGSTVAATLIKSFAAMNASARATVQNMTPQTPGQAQTAAPSITPQTPTTAQGQAAATSQPGGPPAQAQTTQGASQASQAQPAVRAAQGQATQGGAQAGRQGAAQAAKPSAPTALPAGTQAQVRIVATLPPPPGAPLVPPAPGTAVLSAGQTLRGVVTGATPSGQTVVQTGAGVLTLDSSAALPKGTSITLQVAGDPTPPRGGGMAATLPPASAEALLMGRDWPAFKEAMQVLRELNPTATQQFMTTAMPRGDAALAATILGFVSALRQGEIRNWLGEGNVRELQRGRPDLLGRLGEDFNLLGRMAEESPARDWRIMLVPFQLGEEMEQIRMLTRRHGGDEEDGEDGEGGTRFVLDLELSAVGRLQIDGLVHPRQKRVDLIIRTEISLTGKMRDDIRGIYRNAAEITGMVGGVAFQSGPPKPPFVEVDPADVAQDHLGVVV